MADDMEASLREQLSTDERYRGWWQEFVNKYGEEPQISGGDYDYGAAVRGGVVPERYEHDENAYHWPSSLPDGTMLKTEDHPTAWMEHFMQEYGYDPHVAHADEAALVDAMMRRRQ